MESFELKIKWLEPEDIKEVTNDILIDFEQKNIPIDIEKIVEIKYKILPIPIENLPQKAYLTKDLKYIIRKY